MEINNIECKWMKDKTLLINPDGQVLPCCYFANVIYMYDQLKNIENNQLIENKNEITDQIGDKVAIRKALEHDNIIMQYYNSKDEFNIFKNKIENIINSDWFIRDLPESWNSKNVSNICVKYCQKKL